MLSKSHNLNTSGGIASGPAAFPIFNEDFTFLSSSIVNKPSLISRSSESDFQIFLILDFHIFVIPFKE